jgi:predicted PurR-regulated permease PerM
LRGQLTLMLVVGVLTWLGLLALGVPGALGLGTIAGLLEIVPSLGPVIATVAAVLVALRYGSTYLQISPQLLAGLVILFYVLVQQLENLLIVPRVLGDALKLPALLVLVGIAVGAAAGGVLGAVLATPLIATAREVLRYWQRKRRGEEPFPAEEAAR